MREFILGLAALIILSVVVSLLRGKIPYYHLQLRVRIPAILGAIIFLSFFVKNYRQVIYIINTQMDIVDGSWGHCRNYPKNGVLYSFLMNIPSLKVRKPSGYKKSIETEMSNFSQSATTPKPLVGQSPDVIIYMSESF